MSKNEWLEKLNHLAPELQAEFGAVDLLVRDAAERLAPDRGISQATEHYADLCIRKFEIREDTLQRAPLAKIGELDALSADASALLENGEVNEAKKKINSLQDELANLKSYRLRCAEMQRIEDRLIEARINLRKLRRKKGELISIDSATEALLAMAFAVFKNIEDQTMRREVFDLLEFGLEYLIASANQDQGDQPE